MQADTLLPEAVFSAYQPKLRRLILSEILTGEAAPSLASTMLESQPMQVILLSPYSSTAPLDEQALLELVHANNACETVEIVPTGNAFALILKGTHTIRKFRDYADIKLQEDPNISWIPPFPDHIFLACGTVVDTPEQLPQSYSHAKQLMRQRFLCSQGQHVLHPEDLRLTQDRPVLTMLLLEKYTAKLLQYIQTFNRALTSQALQELQQMIHQGNDTPNAICLFFCDLYLQIKEQMKNLYQGYTIPFYSNAHIIRTIFQADCLSDIICFLAQRFDIIMSSIGASSRESVLDDILHYIRHNYNTNITLENIAPLFGYNHSYLGKIFRKKMGLSFNEYVDRLRIDRAKELLLTDNAKVYAISERVGYKNVDYFHVKFRKYVQMSPAEFRKANKVLSNSPDGENSEKGTLFQK